MLTNDAFQAKITSGSVFLNCFHIYPISDACQYAKQVILRQRQSSIFPFEVLSTSFFFSMPYARNVWVSHRLRSVY